MSVFNHYARYYDLLYRDKDYAGEAQFIDAQLRKLGSKPGRMLELGCGTGKHAIQFAKMGWAVTGYDLSESMVKQAQHLAADQSPNLATTPAFSHGDVRTIRNGQIYDAVVSLFHVMSYQSRNEDLQSAFATAAVHAKPGGLFFFDFWYGPAVLSDPPTVRIKRLVDDHIEATRVAEPEVRFNENQVLIKYDLFIKDKRSGEFTEFRETHKMRFWFFPELLHLLSAAGFSLCRSGLCYENQPLGKASWYGWLLVRKSDLCFAQE